ncbi:COX3 and Oxidored q4 domain containing protein [Trichuris trichiura]|uniref:NADH-ubiquinone oxidoreductase chain 3 n=1 Tax=Trichuris trichiura TaxID=36087 RepID=A0A077ZHB2_TRITR|nr:COX3 and Oxidored q4 domain containing protein [Trichuris trichiura]
MLYYLIPINSNNCISRWDVLLNNINGINLLAKNKSYLIVTCTSINLLIQLNSKNSVMSNITSHNNISTLCVILMNLCLTAHAERNNKSFVNNYMITRLWPRIFLFIFLIIQYLEYSTLTFNFTSGIGSSIFFIATGFCRTHDILVTPLLVLNWLPDTDISLTLKRELKEYLRYECGFERYKINRLPFSLNFFLLSITFVLFDVEIIILIAMTSSPVGLQLNAIVLGNILLVFILLTLLIE